MEWQPIENAPKDQYCLGYDPHLKRPFVMIWNVRAGKFDAMCGFGDETPTHWLPLPELWETSMETAPKDAYCLGYDELQKRPFVMIWNVCEGEFVASGGLEDFTPARWTHLPDIPTKLVA